MFGLVGIPVDQPVEEPAVDDESIDSITVYHEASSTEEGGSSSNTGLVIGLIFAIVAALGLIWFLVIRKKLQRRNESV